MQHWFGVICCTSSACHKMGVPQNSILSVLPPLCSRQLDPKYIQQWLPIRCIYAWISAVAFSSKHLTVSQKTSSLTCSFFHKSIALIYKYLGIFLVIFLELISTLIPLRSETSFLISLFKIFTTQNVISYWLFHASLRRIDTMLLDELIL
jgi:hypothetical protein